MIEAREIQPGMWITKRIGGKSRRMNVINVVWGDESVTVYCKREGFPTHTYDFYYSPCTLISAYTPESN